MLCFTVNCSATMKIETGNINSITKLFVLLFCGVLCLTGCNKDETEPPFASGTTGDLDWTLSTDGTLTISGKGEMPSYETYIDSWYSGRTTAPWNEYRDNIIRVTIENLVTSIKNAAFYGCSGLTSVTIGNSVTFIGSFAFGNCTGLTEVINESATPQDVSENVFSYSNISACTLRVPAASIDAYRASPEWQNFGKIEAIK